VACANVLNFFMFILRKISTLQSVIDFLFRDTREATSVPGRN
jgi:hypothetical protein